MLESFGLDANSERVYLTLLQHPGVGAARVAEFLGMDRRSLRAAANRLARLALLRPSADLPGSVRAVSPEIGLEALLARQESAVVRQRNQIDEGRAALAILLAERERDAAPAAAVCPAEQVVGRDAIRQRLEQLMYAARIEVLSASPGGAQAAESLEDDRRLDAFVLRRGLEVRTVYQASIRNVPAASAYARWVADSGGKVRTLPVLPLWFKLVDRRTALLSAAREDGTAGMTVVRDPAVAVAMLALFERIWDEAAPFGDQQPSRPAGELTPEEAELLRLLAEGATDETAARRLSVSVRTVGRSVADLMARLGAQSRFQAGVLVGRYGWLNEGRAPAPASLPPRHEADRRARRQERGLGAGEVPELRVGRADQVPATG
jgi:DNA-binding CsgD family transcriptional regulator/sugar-specific transcriptional regulator TrmB